jgi:hypothetical protein
MEITDQRHGAAHFIERVANVRDGLGSLVTIDRDPNNLGASLGEGSHLRHRSLYIGCVGIGHRLDDDRTAADDNLTNANRNTSAANDM